MRFVIVSAILAHVLATCAPRVGPITMAALVMHESGGRPYAIGDNTARRGYFPTNAGDARRLARALLEAGHSIDVGYAQIDSANFTRLGLDASSAFDPCANVAAGARILGGAYAGAARRYGPGQVALAHALSAYNTGDFHAGLAYAAAVYATAQAAARP